MSYINTFITVAEDCPVTKSEVPVSRTAKKPLHLIQYELLTEHPYRFDHQGLIYEVYTIYKEIPPEVLNNSSKEIWNELFSKGHPCLRASALTKRYGFGAHYNHEGKIATYPMETKEYNNFTSDKTIKSIPAMRSRRN